MGSVVASLRMHRVPLLVGRPASGCRVANVGRLADHAATCIVLITFFSKCGGLVLPVKRPIYTHSRIFVERSFLLVYCAFQWDIPVQQVNHRSKQLVWRGNCCADVGINIDTDMYALLCYTTWYKVCSGTISVFCARRTSCASCNGCSCTTAALTPCLPPCPASTT